MDLNSLISAKAATLEFGYTESHLRRLFRDGRITGHQIGARCTLYDPVSIAEHKATTHAHGTHFRAVPGAARAARRLSGESKARRKAARAAAPHVT